MRCKLFFHDYSQENPYKKMSGDSPIGTFKSLVCRDSSLEFGVQDSRR
jgi:hypothetical protein